MRPYANWTAAVRKLILLCALALLALMFLTGCCDPPAHIYVRNNYAVPVHVHLVGNAVRKIADQMLDTVPPGKRIELTDAPPTDGDIDSMQIEDAHGHILTHLSSTDKNVVCKQKTPDYIWEVTVGP